MQFFSTTGHVTIHEQSGRNENGGVRKRKGEEKDVWRLFTLIFRNIKNENGFHFVESKEVDGTFHWKKYHDWPSHQLPKNDFKAFSIFSLLSYLFFFSSLLFFFFLSYLFFPSVTLSSSLSILFTPLIPLFHLCLSFRKPRIPLHLVSLILTHRTLFNLCKCISREKVKDECGSEGGRKDLEPSPLPPFLRFFLSL